MQFLSNLWNNSEYYLIDADIVSFFAASKSKKAQKIDNS